MINPHYIWLTLVLIFVVVLYSTRQQAIARAKLEERFHVVNNEPMNFQVEMAAQCRADETDTGEFCIKTGCPSKFERGRGPGADLCYPNCLDGYETNGMSRCYQKCPENYTTNGTQCIRPKYTFKKDVKPCVGCVPKHERYLWPSDEMADSWGPTAPEIMVVPTEETVIPVRPSVWTTNPSPNQYYVYNGLMENMDGTVEQTPAKPKPKPTGHQAGHCPPGYTLFSNDQCYENCPPHYNDEGDQCTLDSYVMERDSYDRGAGVPYHVSRKKYHRLSTTCDKN